jgi:hypothetical protein
MESIVMHSNRNSRVSKIGFTAVLAIAWAVLCLSATGWQSGQATLNTLLSPEAGDTQTLLAAAPPTLLRVSPQPEDREYDEPLLPVTKAHLQNKLQATAAVNAQPQALPSAPHRLFQARAPPQYS